MKKILSIAIALLMLLSCISVSADTNDVEITNESVLYEHALSTGALYNGLTDTSEYQYTFRDFGRVGEYSLCYMAGTLTHEVDFNTTIGKYKISTKQERLVNPLGLYLVKGESVYSFNSDTYNNGIINEDELDQIISLINESISDDIFKGWSIKKISLADTQEFCDAVNKYIIINNNGAYLFEQHITDSEDGKEITYTNLLTPENVKTRFLEFYKETENIVIFCIPGVMEMIATEQIGEYVFTASSLFDYNNKCGYCVYYNGAVYGIADAVSENIVTVEELAQVIPYTKHISEIPSENPTNEPDTIPSESVDTNPSTTPSEPKETEPATNTKPAEPTEKTAVTVIVKNIKAGERVKAFKVVNPKNEKVTYIPQNSKIAIVKSKGYVTGLKKGTAKFVVKVGKKSFNCNIKVTSDPKLTKNNKKVKTVVVEKNKTVKVRIVGKAERIWNIYKNTAKAKVISSRKAEVIKIKGLKKGTTNLKITVNGKKLNLKVKVK